MAMLMIKCPLTSRLASTGVEVESSAGFYSLLDVVHHTHCPLCGNNHEWSTHDAWIAKSFEIPRGGNPLSEVLTRSSVTSARVICYRRCPNCFWRSRLAPNIGAWNGKGGGLPQTRRVHGRRERDHETLPVLTAWVTGEAGRPRSTDASSARQSGAPRRGRPRPGDRDRHEAQGLRHR